MNYSSIADGGPDDLPRTLRRERDAREREAREREAAERAQAEREQLSMGSSNHAAGPSPMASRSGGEMDYAVPTANYSSGVEAAMPAAVTRLDVPFFHLMVFFIKAVFAAIPALLLLAVLLWGAGHLLQTYFPWLVKAQILIHFPN